MIPSIPQFTALMGNDKTLKATIAAAKARTDLTAIETRSRAAALAYLEEVWLTLPEKTLGSIVATLSNLLTPFNYPPFDELMAGRSTLSLCRLHRSRQGALCAFPGASGRTSRGLPPALSL